MKKFIYISGIVSANLMLLGALLKVLHMPGASIVLTLSIFLFCFIFLPLALYNNYTSQDEKKNVWLYIVTFIVFFVCILGALFKILHWPGASVFLVLGILSPFVLFLPVYLYQTRKPKIKSIRNNLAVMFGLTFLAVFNVFLALNVSSNVLNSISMSGYNHEQFVKYLGDNFNAPSSNEIKLKAQDISGYIDELKQDVINDALKVKKDIPFSYNSLTIPDKATAVSSIFVIKENGTTSRVGELKLKLDEFYKLIDASNSTSKEIKELTKNLIYSNDYPEVWEIKQFSNNQAVSVYSTLCRIQSNVLFIGSEV